jgi:hypothetical protein
MSGMMMEPVPKIAVPPAARVELKPGGYHPTSFISSDHGFAPQFLAIDASRVLVDLALLSKPQTGNCQPAAGETIGRRRHDTVDERPPLGVAVMAHPTRTGDLVIFSLPPYQFDAATPGTLVARSAFFGQHGYRPDLQDLGGNTNLRATFLATGPLRANFPFLAVNIIDDRTGSEPFWVERSRVFTVNGVKVGVIGAALEVTPELVAASNTEGLTFLPAAERIREESERLRRQGVLVQIVSVIQLMVRRGDVQWAGGATRIAKNLGVAPRGDVQAIVDTANAQTAVLANQVIGKQTVAILRAPTRLFESAMGNMVADAMRAKYPGIDAALTNSGGLRADLPCSVNEAPCDITWGEVFAVLPFGNRTVIETVTGAQLTAAFVNGFSPFCHHGNHSRVDILRRRRGRAPSGSEAADRLDASGPRHQQLGREETARLKADLLDRARAVATASGGVFGLGSKVSSAEAAMLAQLEAAFLA